MLIGYARVSTAEQNIDAQLDALKAAGCERIFTDKASGTRTDRQGLTQALDFAREGDSLVIWKLDRLGRSMQGLIDLSALLDSRKINLQSLTDSINTRSVSGRFFFNLMASLATMERDLIRERTMAGLAAAKRAGRIGGRPRVMTPEKLDAARTLLAADKTPKDVANSIGVSMATLYRHLPAGTHKKQK